MNKSLLFLHYLISYEKNFFPKMPFDLYLILSMVLSFVSVWYAIAAPALYCTAIMSAVCMEIISLNLMVRVVWDSEQEKWKKNGRIVRKFPVCIIGIWMPTDYCTFRNTPDYAVLFASA